MVNSTWLSGRVRPGNQLPLQFSYLMSKVPIPLCPKGLSDKLDYSLHALGRWTSGSDFPRAPGGAGETEIRIVKGV